MDGTILGKKYDIIGGSGGGGHITPATTETLGGVIVGDGLSVTEEGVLSANSQTWNYSTNEVNTGQKWIDGKDIYCKVYNNVQLTNGTDVTIDANFGTDKNLIKIEGVGHYNSGNEKIDVMLSNYLAGNDKAVPKVADGVLLVEVKDNWSAWTCHLIIYYTKTEA